MTNLAIELKGKNTSASKLRNYWIHIVLLIATVLMIGPFVWMFLTSIKTYEETIRVPIIWFPEQIQWVNYQIVNEKFPFLVLYLNTILVVVATVIAQLAMASLAAYAFARLNFPGKNVLFLFMLSLLMVPGQIFLIPQYQIIVGMNLTDTLTAIVLPNMFSVFGVFLLRQFFAAIPKELEDAARIDGCNNFRIYWQIMLPLVTPGLVAMGILTMIGAWKELLWPLIVNQSIEKMTLSAGLANLIGEHTTYHEQVMAGAVISVLPMIIIFAFFQRKFVESIAQTGVKG
ncbi:MAG: carbohydrate ABC transporter permease [Candidatus Nanopelagicales bacterium]